MGRQSARRFFFLSFIFIAVCSQAQYKGDDIPGFLGLQSGTQAPPGLYVGNVVWVYPTDTIKAQRALVLLEPITGPVKREIAKMEFLGHCFSLQFSPTRRCRSMKRGSPRTGSKKGCTLRYCRILDCSL
jgi:hypothetical protein